MAVDANIITFERFREDCRVGKSVLSAVRSGSRTSFRTIMDSNLTTIIAAAVLFGLGQGAIKGFALTLIIEHSGQHADERSAVQIAHSLARTDE